MGCLLAVAVFFFGIPLLCCAGFLLIASPSKSRVEQMRHRVEEKKHDEDQKDQPKKDNWPTFQFNHSAGK